MSTHVAAAVIATMVIFQLTSLAHAADASATWLNGDGNWIDPTQWSTNPAFPNNGTETYAATLSAGDITLDQDITVDQLTLQYVALPSNPAPNTTLHAYNSLTVNSDFTLDTATIVGDSQGIISSNGTATISGTNILAGSTLTLGGTTSLSGTTILETNGVFANQAGATLNMGDGSSVGAEGTFNNDGTVNINAAFAGASIGGVVNNAGTINVNTGTLDLISGAIAGTFSGNLFLASGTTVNWNGPQIYTATSVISGAGNVYFTNGGSDLIGTYNISGETYFQDTTMVFGQPSNPQISMGTVVCDAGATVDFESPLQASGAVTVEATDALVAFASNTVLSSFKLVSGTVLDEGNVTVSNTLEWDSGTISGPGVINANGGVFFKTAGPNVPVLTGTLNCSGTISDANVGLSGGINFGTYASMNVLSGNTLEIESLDIFGSASIGTFYGTFTNRGTLIVDAAFGATGSIIENEGDIELHNSEIRADSGSSSIAAFNQDGGVMNLSNGTLLGTFAFNSGKLSGNGSFGNGIYSEVINNNGFMAPSGGSLSVTQGCSLNLESNSVLSFSLGGAQPGSTYGQIDNLSTTNGNITLGGQLQVMFTNGFQSQVTSGDVFTLIAGTSSFVGQFTNVQDGQRMITTDGVGSFLVSTEGGAVTLSDYQITPYGTWQINTFSAQDLNDPTKSGAEATPQHDGVPNLLKYVYGIDPTVPMTASDFALLPAVGVTSVGNTMYQTMIYHQDLSASGLNVQAQVSSDLQNWQSVASAQTGTDSNGDAVMQAQTPVMGTCQFMRLNVTQQ